MPPLRLILCLTILASPAAQQPTFRSGTEAVLVDVQVTSGGRPITGLTAADFELRDSAIRQDIQVVSFADVPISLLLALDVSASVGERLDGLIAAARQAIGALRPGDQAAVLTFNDRLAMQAEWSEDHRAVAARLGGLRAQGATALYDGIFSAVALRGKAAGRVVLLVFSDGLDTASVLSAREAIEAARRSDLVTTVVSAGARVRPSGGRESLQLFGLDANLRRWFESDPPLFPYSFLDVLSADTGGDLLRVSSDAELAPAFQRIVAEFKNRYLLTYTARGVPADGWHPIEVSLEGRRADIKARRGYWREPR